jgi:cAMP-dependent protein kinase regulator
MRFWKKKEPEDYINRKEYSQAIELLRERLAAQPKNIPIKTQLADTLLLANHKDEAIDEYGDLARLYKEQGFYIKAIAVYKRILKIDPALPEIQTLLENLSRQVEATVSGSIRRVETARAPEQIETQLFKDLSPAEFKQIVNSLSLQHYPSNQVVVKEGDPGDSMFVVVRGEVRVITRDMQQREFELAKLGEGQFFGEVALLTGKPRTATILTSQDCELLKLTKSDYDNIVQRYPNIKKVLEEFHVKRAYQTVEAMLQSFHSQERNMANNK